MAILEIMKGASAGQLLEIREERTVIGRHPTSDIILDDGAVSRHHVEIIYDNGHYFIEDLSSRNGTEVNQMWIRERYALKDRDTIRICNFKFRFLLSDPNQLCHADNSEGLQQKISFNSFSVDVLMSTLMEANVQVHVHGAGCKPLEQEIFNSESVLHQRLRTAFEHVVVFDCRQGMTGGSMYVESEAFLRHVGKQLADTVGIDSDSHQFHPEQIAQILQDMVSAFYCFLHVELLDDGVLHHLRGLGFNSNDNRTVFSGDNVFLERRSLPNQYVRSQPLSANVDADGARDRNECVINPLEGDASSQVSSAQSSLRLNVRPEVKLRAILEMGSALGRVLDLELVFSVILKSLFKIFNQANAGFVLLKDADSNRLKLHASQCLAANGDEEIPVNMTVVRQAMDQTQAILSADVVGDSRFRSSESLTDLKLRSLMCAPLLSTDGDAIGVIQLSTLEISSPFTADDLDLLVSVSAQASLAVENARLHDVLLRQRDMERDLEFAAMVQQGFLPHQPPQIEGFEFCDYYKSAHYIGGDYFDYVKLTDGRIAIAIGDVAGKGISAALLMARLHASVRYHLLTSTSPAVAMANLNNEITNSGLGFRLITLVFAVLDPSTNLVCIVNAGHLAPAQQTTESGNHFVGIAKSGLPIGVLPQQTFNGVTIELKPAEMLLFYTDGITEAFNAKKEMYGKHRLIDILGTQYRGAGDLVSALISSVEHFCGDAPLRDDVCAIAVRRTS